MNYYISDLHLGHANIFDYEESRWEFIGTTQQKAITKYFIDNNISMEVLTYEFDKLKKEVNQLTTRKFIDKIIEEWNKKITNKDDVYILGDLFFIGSNFNIEEAKKVLNSLNGKLHLIIGNHDEGYINKFKDTNLFASIDYYKRLKDNNRVVILSHYPIEVWDRQNYGSIHIHGHTHNTNQERQVINRYNCGCMNIGFVPVSLDELIGGIK